MKANSYALFFLLIFSMFLITPSVIKLIEKDADISCFFNALEEEEKNMGEETPDTFIFTVNHEYTNLPFTLSNQGNFFVKKNFYPNIILDQSFPPPEFIS